MAAEGRSFLVFFSFLLSSGRLCNILRIHACFLLSEGRTGNSREVSWGGWGQRDS